MGGVFDKVWETLDQPVVESFGAECASIMTWAVLTCALRVVLVAAQLQRFVPPAVLFACPPLLQAFLKKLGLGVTPNLPVRIAESLLGRAGSVAFVIPAHFIGGILGVTLVKLLLVDALAKQLGGGWAGQALLPVIYHLQQHGGGDSSSSGSTGLGWQMFFLEMGVSFFFVLGYLVLPEILKVNRLPVYWAWLVLAPLLFVKVPDQGTTLSPSSLYALWYSSREEVLQTYQVDTIQYEHVFGPILGGFLAGAVMVFLFPDEPSWNPMG